MLRNLDKCMILKSTWTSQRSDILHRTVDSGVVDKEKDLLSVLESHNCLT